MKLAKEQVDKVVELVLGNLKDKKLIVFKADEDAVKTKMVEAFIGDLKAEDDLDREVEGILNSHSNTMDSERIDYRRMFNMIKFKLARERGLTL